jgi:hypothetical protein
MVRFAVIVLMLLAFAPAFAHDEGQWEANSATIQKWFRDLMRPDLPGNSCCGEADAYWADSYEVEGDHYVAIITDERDDAPLRRPHIDVGTRIPVPNEKLKWDQSNPTGHGVIFMSVYGSPATPSVFCFIAPGGV